MTDLLTYNLQDFVMHSRDTYWAVQSDFATDMFPIQFAWLAIAGFLVWLRKKNSKLVNLALSWVIGLSWIWVGLVYYFAYYQQINWSAWHLGLTFAIFGALSCVSLFFTHRTKQKVGLPAVVLVVFAWHPDALAALTLISIKSNNWKIRTLWLTAGSLQLVHSAALVALMK